MVVDTSFVIDLMRERHHAQEGLAIRFLRQHAAAKLRMPVFVACELELGLRRWRNQKRERERLAALREFMEIAYPGTDSSAIYGAIASQLLETGNPVPVMDALIACVAAQHAEPLVTRDAPYFRQIPGLVVESY